MQTEIKLEYQDLLYFGYDHSKDRTENKKLELEFIKEIKIKFPNVELKDSYDEIKGLRQTVYLNEEENDNYYAWIIGNSWAEFSLTMQLIMMSYDEPEQKEKFDKYLALAKEQYPPTV